MDEFHPAGPARHDDDPVGERDRLREVVGDEDDRLVARLPHAQELRVEGELGVGVERAEGLVHQEDLGVDDERAHERHALPHPAGERRREGVLEPLEPREPDPLAYPALLLAAPDATVLEPERDVAAHGAPREDGVLLEDVADVRRHVRHGPAVELDRPFRRRHEPAEHVEDRRLAAPRRPDDRDELLVGDLERHVVDGLHPARALTERLREVPDDDAGSAGAQDVYLAWARRTNDMSTARA